MPLIPGNMVRGRDRYSDTTYAPFGIAAWQAWCRGHGLEFRLLDRSELEAGDDPDIPPTIQRWMAAKRILVECGPSTRIAMVDADTMIRWDAPNFFGLAGDGLTAVPDPAVNWIHRSIRAYRHLFPGVQLQADEYFNAGFVVLGAKHLRILETYLGFIRRSWSDLRDVQKSGNFGSDQTPFNFVVKQMQEPVTFLPAAFNCVHCFPLDAELLRIERADVPDCSQFAAKAFALPGSFQFIEAAYVWHFTGLIACRRPVMEETWRRVSHHYA